MQDLVAAVRSLRKLAGRQQVVDPPPRRPADALLMAVDIHQAAALVTRDVERTLFPQLLLPLTDHAGRGQNQGPADPL